MERILHCSQRTWSERLVRLYHLVSSYVTYPSAIARVRVGVDALVELSSTVVARKANMLMPENCLGYFSILLEPNQGGVKRTAKS